MMSAYILQLCLAYVISKHFFSFMWKNDCSRALGLEHNMSRHNIVNEPIALTHTDQNKQYHAEGGLQPIAKLTLQQSAATSTDDL